MPVPIPLTIADTIRRAITALQGVSGSPRLDAELILGHVLDQRREYLIAHGEEVIPDLKLHTFDKLLKLRQKGMPVAYLLGRRAFMNRDFIVTPHVLIPRPETEHVVDAAIAWAAGRGPLRIIDVGTGSGIIALSLAAHLPQAQVIAADVSAVALVVARDNGADLANVEYVQSDLLEAVDGGFDIICANLPYIASAELNVLEVARFEPAVALDGGADGLTLIRRLLARAPVRLNTPGLLLLEIGADQGAAVAALAQAAFPAGQVDVIKDYARLDRVVQVMLSESASE
jgi:release factor glutamine methyltransferase